MSMAILAALAQVLDLGSFLLVVSLKGIEAEGNPVVVRLYETSGPVGVILAKSVILAAIPWLHSKRSHRFAFWVLMIAYVVGYFGFYTNVIGGLMK